MSVTIKSAREIELMRTAGKLLEEVHNELAAFVKPGISTLDIDRYGEKLIRERGCIPNVLNYNGYPAAICVSVNDEVVHGIPHADHILQEGDIVSLDAGLIYKGYHSDAARTHAVGKISPEAQQLIDVTKQSFFEGIRFAREGYRISDIGGAIQDYVESHGYSVVREYVGHGVGHRMHEAPEVPNYRIDRHLSGRSNPRLVKGMTIAVEPMVNMGGYEVKVLDNDWTVVTVDGSLSAHYENTILITDGEPEILTMAEDL